MQAITPPGTETRSGGQTGTELGQNLPLPHAGTKAPTICLGLKTSFVGIEYLKFELGLYAPSSLHKGFLTVVRVWVQTSILLEVLF